MEIATPFVVLLGILLLIYAFDLAVALPPNALVFRSELGGAYSVRTARQSGLRIRDNLYLVRAPLLPWGRIFVVAPPPLNVDDEHVSLGPAFSLVPSAPPGEPETFLYDKLGKIGREVAVLEIQGRRLRCACAELARRWQHVLATLRDGSPELRRRWLHMSQRLALPRQRLRFYLLHSLELRVLSTLLTLFLFALLISLSLSTAWLSWLQVGLIYLALVVAIAAFAFVLRRRYLPRQVAHRWLKTLAILISPAEAMTAPHVLSREILATHDGLTVAQELLSPTLQQDLADRVLRSLCADPQAPPELCRALKRHVRELGLDANAWERSPEPHAGAHCYCPRCHEQFSREQASCAACGDRATRPFVAREPATREGPVASLDRTGQT